MSWKLIWQFYCLLHATRISTYGKSQEGCWGEEDGIKQLATKWQTLVALYFHYFITSLCLAWFIVSGIFKHTQLWDFLLLPLSDLMWKTGRRISKTDKPTQTGIMLIPETLSVWTLYSSDNRAMFNINAVCKLFYNVQIRQNSLVL